MAFGAGKNGVFKLDDGGGTLRDISTYVSTVAYETSQGQYDVTTLQAAFRAWLSGFSEGRLRIGGFFDPTVDGYLAGTDTIASRSFEFYPAGTPVGATKPEYSGECIKVNYSITDPVDGVVGFTLELMTTGTVTRAVA